MVFTLWIIATLIFVIVRATPGDPTAYLIDPTFPANVKHQLIASFGLDTSVFHQYLLYLKNLAMGDLGRSFFYQQPVVAVLGRKLANTAILAVASFVIAYGLGIVGGVLLARVRGSRIDGIASVAILLLRSAPVFWTGIIALIIFSFRLNWVPYGGMRTPGYSGSTYFTVDFLRHLVLPAVVTGLYYLALPLLLVRSAMIEILDEDFMELARAKGLSPRRILYKHGLRNSLLPVVTEAAVYVGSALGGVAVVEVVFSWPGLGREIVLALTRHDYPVATGAFVMLALCVCAMNFLADLLYGYLDPRVTSV